MECVVIPILGLNCPASTYCVQKFAGLWLSGILEERFQMKPVNVYQNVFRFSCEL